MKILIKYFGQIAEIAGGDKEKIELNDSFIMLHDLEKLILSKHPNLKTFQFKLAVNLKITKENISLKNNDEICFLPPFSGG